MAHGEYKYNTNFNILTTGGKNIDPNTNECTYTNLLTYRNAPSRQAKLLDKRNLVDQPLIKPTGYTIFANIYNIETNIKTPCLFLIDTGSQVSLIKECSTSEQQVRKSNYHRTSITGIAGIPIEPLSTDAYGVEVHCEKKQNSISTSYPTALPKNTMVS